MEGNAEVCDLVIGRRYPPEAGVTWDLPLAARIILVGDRAAV